MAAEHKSSWTDWNAHIINARGCASGGIFTQKGAIAAQAGVTITADQILGLKACFDGDSTSITFGDNKFMLLKNDGDALHFRAGSVPASVFRTKVLYLIAIGHADASSGNLASDVDMIVKQLKLVGL